MCEGLSTIHGPIPPHPMFLNDSSSRISSRSENNSICEGPSKLSGPIVSHFGVDNDSQAPDYAVNPRVRDAGKANFLKNKNGNGVGLLIELQGRPVTPSTYKIREPPKNHIAANTFKIKQIMRKVKEREQQKERELSEKSPAVKALWKSDKYKDVQSKLKEMMLQQPLAPREEKREFLKAHSRTGSISRPQSARQAPKEDMSLALNQKKFASKDDLDFIKHNQLVVKQMQIRRAPSVEMLKQVQEKLNHDLEKYNQKVKGKIPHYLDQRNKEIEKQKEDYIKNLPDPDQPPGHRKLAEEERQKTLNLLEDAHKKLMSELNTLPIRTDTFRIKSAKNDMEKRLVELDEAIKIFSKPKVFVKIDS